MGRARVIAVPGAANPGRVAMISGRTAGPRCDQSGHEPPTIAIPAAGYCGSLHLCRSSQAVAPRGPAGGALKRPGSGTRPESAPDANPGRSGRRRRKVLVGHDGMPCARAAHPPSFAIKRDFAPDPADCARVYQTSTSINTLIISLYVELPVRNNHMMNSGK